MSACGTDFPALGIHSGITNVRYHADRTCVSKSWIDKAAKSPLHLRHYLDAPPMEPTPAMVLGSLTHTRTLEPDKTFLEFAVAPKVDRRTKAGKAEHAEFLEMSEGKTVVTEEQFHLASAMARSVKSHPVARGLLTNGIAESSVVWHDKLSGLLCKCRPDYMHATDTALGTTVIDLKTTKDASPRAFAKAIANFRYHVQSAFYLDGVSAATGVDMDAFLFVAVENEPPHAVAVYAADDMMVEIGRDEYRRDLAVIAECQASGQWPGYADEITELSLPAWAAST